MSDSVRPHRQAAHQAPRPWDCPDKNTGVGCHFLLHCMKMKSEREAAQSCPTLRGPMDCSPPGSSVHGIFQARVLEWGAIAFSTRSIHVAANGSTSFFLVAEEYATGHIYHTYLLIHEGHFSCFHVFMANSWTPIVRCLLWQHATQFWKR